MFPSLAALAARAAAGEQRDTVLASLVVCRLAAALGPPAILSPEALRERADAARAWLVTHQLTGDLRGRFAQLINATGSGDPRSVAAELETVLESVRGALDAPAQNEVTRLIARLRR